jgi:glycosyltransferase involved in cell wall biosynthesis
MDPTAKKRILVLSPRFPYPVIGGDRLRIYEVCKALSQRFSLTLLSLCETRGEMDFPIPNDGVFDRVERVLLSKTRSYLNMLMILATPMPLQVGYYRSATFQEAVARLLPEHDGVLSHLIRCAEYVRHAETPKFLEMTDAISLNYSRFRTLKGSGGLKGIVYAIEAGRLKRYEQKIMDDFDLSILVSEIDRDFLTNGRGSEKILVASNGVDIARLRFVERTETRPVIAYIGKMTSVQNMDACLFFASKVLPVLRQRVDAIFRVVGQIDAKDAERLRKFSGVEVTGSVGSVDEAVRDARIGVCPVRLAAGVQNKVLEYMALGLPVVCSRIGLEGLSATPEKELLLADTPSEYARQIERLWVDENLRAELAKNARKYVLANHDWAANLSPLVASVDKLLR